MLQSCLEVAKLAVDGGARQLALEFHPHQKHQLACASQSGSVFVVDSMTTRNAAMFPGLHTAPVTGLGWVSAAPHVLTSCGGHLVALSDIRAKSCVGKIATDAGCTALATPAEGRSDGDPGSPSNHDWALAVGMQDGGIAVYDLRQAQAPMSYVPRFLPGAVQGIEWQRGVVERTGVQHSAPQGTPHAGRGSVPGSPDMSKVDVGRVAATPASAARTARASPGHPGPGQRPRESGRGEMDAGGADGAQAGLATASVAQAAWAGGANGAHAVGLAGAEKWGASGGRGEGATGRVAEAEADGAPLRGAEGAGSLNGGGNDQGDRRAGQHKAQSHSASADRAVAGHREGEGVGRPLTAAEGDKSRVLSNTEHREGRAEPRTPGATAAAQDGTGAAAVGTPAPKIVHVGLTEAELRRVIREEIAQAVSDIKRDVRESLRELSLEIIRQLHYQQVEVSSALEELRQGQEESAGATRAMLSTLPGVARGRP